MSASTSECSAEDNAWDDVDLGDVDMAAAAPAEEMLQEAGLEGDFDDVAGDLDAMLLAAGAAASAGGGGGDAAAAAGGQAVARAKKGGRVNELLEVWDSKVAPTVGSRARRVTDDGGLTRHEGKSHPKTRTVESFQRAGLQLNNPGRDENESSRDYNSSQTLIRRSVKDAILQWLEVLFKHILEFGKTPSGKSWLTISKRFDETMFSVRLSKKEGEEWTSFILQRLKAERFYRDLATQEEIDADVERLQKFLLTRRVGHLHMLAQNIRLRWAQGEDNVMNIIVDITALQRTSASNLKAATEAVPGRQLSLGFAKERLAGALAFLLLHFGSDEGSGCVRFTGEVKEMFKDVFNVAIADFICYCHVLGTATADSIDVEGCLSFLVRWSKLIRFHEYFDTWSVGMGLHARQIVASGGIKHASLHHFTAEVRASDNYWNMLGAVTLLRETVTQSCSHPLDPEGAMSPADRKKVADRIEHLKGVLKRLSVLLQIQDGDFKKGMHVCYGPPICKCWHTPSNWSEEFAEVWGEAVDTMIPHGVQAARTKYLSWSQLLGLGQFTFMGCELGSLGWLEGYSVKNTEAEVDKHLASEPQTDEEQFKRDSSIRLAFCSKHIARLQNRVFICSANYNAVGSDKLFRFMDRCASAKNYKLGYTPLILQIVEPDPARNPLTMFFVEQTQLLAPGSGLVWSLHQWYNTYGMDIQMFRHQSWRALTMVVEEMCHVKLKMGFPVEFDANFQVWRTVSQQLRHGVQSIQALVQSQRLHDPRVYPDCEIDVPFTSKVMGEPRGTAAQFLVSTELECCRESAEEMRIINLDEERLLSTARSVAYGDQSKTVSTVTGGVFIRELRHEHELRGGTVYCGKLKGAEIESHQLEILQRRQRTRRGAYQPGEMAPWGLYYLEKVAPQWQASRKAKVEMELRGGRKAVKKTAYRKERDEEGGVRWVKGLGAWETYLSFLRKMALRYSEMPGVKERYEAKARQWNADYPKAPVPPVDHQPLVSEERSYMGIGQTTTPVRADVLKKTVAKWTPKTVESHPTFHREPGPAVAARLIHGAEDGALFIKDPQMPGPLPSLTRVPKTCGMSWPGYCEKLDNDVGFVVKDICQNLNTLCSGRSPASLHGRVWRFDFLSVRPDGVGGPSHRHSDLFVGHVRLSKPQVQVFAPLQQVGDEQWEFICKPSGELYVATSYRQMKLITRQIFRFSASTGQHLYRVWLHEVFGAPVPNDKGLMRMKRVACKDIGLKYLLEDDKPLKVWPGVTPPSARKTSMGAEATEKAPAAEEDGEAAFRKLLESDRREQRGKLMDKYMEKFRRSFLDGKPVRGGKRHRPGAVPKGKAAAAKPKAAGPAGAAGGHGGAAAGGAAAGAAAAAADADEEGSSDGADGGEGGSDSEAPMPWEHKRWAEGGGDDEVCPGDIGVLPMQGGSHLKPLFPGRGVWPDVPHPPPVPAPAPPAPAPMPAPAAAAALGPAAAAPAPAPPPPPPLPPPDSASDSDVQAFPVRRRRDTPARHPDSESRIIEAFGARDQHHLRWVVPGGGPNAMATAIAVECDRHADAPRVRRGFAHIHCRRRLNLSQTEQGDSREELLRQLKHWVVLGYTRPCDCVEIVGAVDAADPETSTCSARKWHMGLKPRQLMESPPSDLLDRLVAEGNFAEAELSFLR